MKPVLILVILAFVVVSTGCDTPIATDEYDYGALASSRIPLYKAYVVPAGPPTPDQGACPNCGGKGRLGDGVVTVVCPVCGGTGKKPATIDVPVPPGDNPGLPAGDVIEPVDQPRPRSRRLRLFRSSSG